MLTLLFAPLSIACAVAAQTAITTVGIPPCLVTCAEASCSLNDLQCTCFTNMTDIIACVSSNCSSADQSASEAFLGQRCGILHHVIIIDPI